MGIRRRYRRSDLFLVRIWLQDSDSNGKEGRRGRVQRVLDGEAYQFNDWFTTIQLLVPMVWYAGSTPWKE